MRPDRYLILVGMMGSGKSSVGRKLAEIADVPFQDTDRILERRLGRPILQWFALYGEQAFRDHETKVLVDLQPEPGVLATGGGIVLRDENWVQLRRLGTTVFLDVDEECLKQRLAVTRKRRPLLEAEDWEEKIGKILNARRSLYELADKRVCIRDEEVDVVAAKVAEAAGWI
ncbi:MAG: shikimate kinase [Fimbriimonadaceae bacterium]|nr:shikimate kinase [Fimbriimonadaceae bacterium]QYK55854.1 MAG: shikimate kinase [Fimbriimonadaceae bacterium]